MSIRIFKDASLPLSSLYQHKSSRFPPRLPIMSILILNSPSLPPTGLGLSRNSSQDVQLPDITRHIKPYLLRTLEMMLATYGPSPHIEILSRNLSYEYYRTGIPRPTTYLETYCMKVFTDRYRLPHRLPFISDDCAQIIPFATSRSNHGVMEDIIEAIRRTTVLHLTEHYHHPHHQQQHPTFYPPTTGDIQTYLSHRWPEKYPPANGVASGWRNTVNQCLTHGQGWNFLTFPPIDGTKNKRHLLFERAFNGMYIVGSGQCKGLNDLKPKTRTSITRTRRTAFTTAARSTASDRTSTNQEGQMSPYMTPTPEFVRRSWDQVGGGRMQWSSPTTFEELWQRAREPKDPGALLERAEAGVLASMIPDGGSGHVGSPRSLHEIEVELMGMFRSMEGNCRV